MSQIKGKIFDVIVVGELNVDLIMNQIESFPETGKEKLAENMTFTLGSSAAIFASNLCALGMKVSFIGKAGNDIFGRFCKEQLEGKGVDTSMLIMSEEYKTGATVVLNFNEDRANVTYQGAMAYLEPEDISEEMISRGKHLHFSSYFLQPGFRNKLDGLFKMAKKAGLTTSLDVQWDPQELWDFDFKTVLPYVDVFLPNECELLNLTKKELSKDAISVVSKYGNVIVVKRGNKGSMVIHNKRLFECKPFLNEQVVDAIGAGDSFNAGFIFRYLQDDTTERCQLFANLIGAISTTRAGGTAAFKSFYETMKIAKEKFGYEEE
jgi:sugar/nucleoside kinase (ribokinase family)